MAVQRLRSWKPSEKDVRNTKFTVKQAAFVDEYMISGNGSEACLKAGYKTTDPIRMAAELVAHPKIAAEIKRRQDVRSEKSELSAQYVIQKLIKIVEDTDKDNPQAALRGLELLGRHLGMYRDKQEISGPDGDAIRVQEQKTEENVTDFTRKLSRLAASRGAGNVVEFPRTRGEGEAEL